MVADKDEAIKAAVMKGDLENRLAIAKDARSNYEKTDPHFLALKYKTEHEAWLNKWQRLKVPHSVELDNPDDARDLFLNVLKDETHTDNPFWLDSYDQIIDWLKDNKNKGLLLMGNVGRSKTTAAHVVRDLLTRAKFKFRIDCLTAYEMNREYRKIIRDPEIDPDNILFPHSVERWGDPSALFIDDIGVEDECFSFGERSIVFNEIVDHAERIGRLLIVTTNLNTEELRNKYGDRTIDRLKELTKPIVLTGDSLRGAKAIDVERIFEKPPKRYPWEGNFNFDFECNQAIRRHDRQSDYIEFLEWALQNIPANGAQIDYYLSVKLKECDSLDTIATLEHEGLVLMTEDNADPKDVVQFLLNGFDGHTPQELPQLFTKAKATDNMGIWIEEIKPKE